MTKSVASPSWEIPTITTRPRLIKKFAYSLTTFFPKSLDNNSVRISNISFLFLMIRCFLGLNNHHGNHFFFNGDHYSVKEEPLTAVSYLTESVILDPNRTPRKLCCTYGYGHASFPSQICSSHHGKLTLSVVYCHCDCVTEENSFN